MTKGEHAMQQYKWLIAKELLQSIPDMNEAQIVDLIEYPPNPEMGDLSLPCFKLSKQLRKSPQIIADELQASIQAEWVQKAVSVNGYLNIYLNKDAFISDVVKRVSVEGDRYGSQAIGEGKTIVIDFSSPNIAKPFHVAHLRSTVIGSSLYRIHQFLGYNCVGINHLGDWGTQFGKLMVAYRNWGNAEQVEQIGIDELLRLYVKFHDEAEQHPELEEEARQWFVKMEQGNEEALSLWKWFVDISLAEFKRIYALLGVQFDSFAGESFYNGLMEPVVQQLKDKGLLEEDEGAWLVRLDDYGMSPALILKKDGSTLYHTRDITAALYRKETYNFEKAIYVTDYAQNLHFQQWFKVIELMGYDWAKDLVHVAFGRVSLEGMSLSTRKGNVVKLEEVLTQSIAKTKAIMEARSTKLDNIDEVARQVGVGAVIFNDLSSNRIKDVSFSWDDALNFDGETGPYVQYTYARASTLLRKAATEHEDVSSEQVDAAHLSDSHSYEVMKQLSMFGEKIEAAQNKLEPSIITRYIIDLAQAFNRYYHEHPILVEDRSIRRARLALVSCVQTTLKNGLYLIGLEAPEKI